VRCVAAAPDAVHVENPVSNVAVVKAAAQVSPVALAQLGRQPPRLSYPAVLVGPEGGWGPEELASGLPTVGLGPTGLRVETAAGVLLCGLRSGVVAPS